MQPFAYVLGAAQDGGHPQPGCTRPCCRDVAAPHLPACLAVVDGDQRWLIDATPALPEQLARLGAVAPGPISGILLTHAHMGHYTGLVHLGREGMGLRDLPLYVQPRMATFLSTNGPWSQLVQLGNVRLEVGHGWTLSPRIRVEAIPVAHRDEYSETVAFLVRGPARSLLWLPDLDAWDDRLPGLIAGVDAAWIDGTFWADGELERPMTEVPHPRIRETIERLQTLPERDRVRFVHLNHTNPAWRPASAEAAAIRAAGMAVAHEGERLSL